MPLDHVRVSVTTLAHVRAIPPPHRIPADIRARLERELRTPGRYRRTEAPPVHPTWLQSIVQWVHDRWNDLWSALAAHVHVGRFGRFVAGDLLVGAFFLIVAFLAARMLGALQWRHDGGVALAPLEHQRSAHALFARADAAAGSGDYALAVRLVFAAAITLLDLRGVVRDEASATVNDLHRVLANRGAAIAVPFDAIADAYTAAAYAEVPIGIDVWQRAERAYESLSRSAVMP